jgi:hypothetical protein
VTRFSDLFFEEFLFGGVRLEREESVPQGLKPQLLLGAERTKAKALADLDARTGSECLRLGRR